MSVLRPADSAGASATSATAAPPDTASNSSKLSCSTAPGPHCTASNDGMTLLLLLVPLLEVMAALLVALLALASAAAAVISHRLTVLSCCGGCEVGTGGGTVFGS